MFSKDVKVKEETGEAIKKQAKKPAHVSLLDMKRSNNVNIVLTGTVPLSNIVTSGIKIPEEEIKQAIINLDGAKLGVQNLKMLQQLVPTNDELELVKNFDGLSDVWLSSCCQVTRRN